MAELKQKKLSFNRLVEDMPIFRKGLFLMLIPILFQLLSVVMFWLLYDQIKRGGYWLAHSRALLEDVDLMHVALNAGYYNAVLSVVVKTWEVERHEGQSLAEAEALIRQIGDRVQDSPSQLARVGRMRTKFDAFMMAMNELNQTSAKPTEVEPLPRPANSVGEKTRTVLSLFKTSLELKDELDQEIAELREVENSLQTERAESVNRTVETAGWFVLGGFITILSFSSLLFVLFRDSIARRLSVMCANLRRIELGETLSEPLTGQDEIARVDGAIHTLAGALGERALDNEVFLYSVSHDLRSPLVNLSGFTDELGLSTKELRTQLEELDRSGADVGRALEIIDTDCERSFDFIRVAISRLSLIVDALLQLSRAGRVKYLNDPVSLTQVVSRVVQSLGRTIAEKQVEVRVEDLPVVYGDEPAYERIFANLLSNALMYLDPSRPGVVRIGVRSDRTERGFAQVYVRDNGVGISESSMKKLFWAFQRFQPDAGPGEGIGLAITRRVITSLGGKIFCESEEGVGSTFVMTVPMEAGQRLMLPEADLGF